MNTLNPKVNFYFLKAKKWQIEIEKLRSVILGCGLDEVLKWGVPCYTSGGRNIVLVHVFKDYCAILFFKGALLKDSKKILIQQTENVQAARQVRFTSIKQITKLEKTLKSYIHEAVQVENAGLKVTFKKTGEYKVPQEFQTKMNELPALKAAFKSLTPGRQRAYLLFFSAPKQSKTRISRVEKNIQNILMGRGLNDQIN